jgi:2,3-bisphosphoglycerate-independent phosphoglycerate mutase
VVQFSKNDDQIDSDVRLLFIFLDGVGLGIDDPGVNPFSRFGLPHIEKMLGGHKFLANGIVQNDTTGKLLANTMSGSLFALDACLGVEGIPQSATGQASLMTGTNVPAMLGYHEGPKPTPPIINLIENGTMLSELAKHGKSAALVNAFPERYFEAIEANYRIPGVIALSTRQAGFQLKTAEDLMEGNAISADLIGEGWRSHLGLPNTPVLSLDEAGRRLCQLAGLSDLSIFEYWLTDMAGHHQDLQAAQSLLETLDCVMDSLIRAWDFNDGLILLTSDHGNLEDLSSRRHTKNNVPLLIIGSNRQRKRFVNLLVESQALSERLDLTSIAPAIISYFS